MQKPKQQTSFSLAKRENYGQVFVVRGLTRIEPKKCQHSNKIARAYNHTIVNLCFSLCFLCHKYIGCKLNCLLNSVRQNLLRNLKCKDQPNQFKTSILTEKLSSVD